MSIEVNKPAPDFTLPATNDKLITLSGLQGHNVVLYFYPKDNTPGCTQQGECFRDMYPDFTKLDAIVLGISRDSLTSHEKFKTKYHFPFELLSDADGKVCELYEVIKDKNMYGKMVKGIERSAFLIDKNGVLRKVLRKVKADACAAEMLAALQAIYTQRT